MAPKNAKRGLGKGLDALIAPAPAASKSGKTTDVPEEGQVSIVNITKVEPNRDQPRKLLMRISLLNFQNQLSSMEL